MALLTFLPPVNLVGTTSLVQLLAAPPAGYIEQFNLRASLISGSADAFANVWVNDNVGSNDGYVAWNEVIRYATSGGATDILVNYILHPNYSLQISASAPSVINFQAYNRVQKKIS